MAATVALTLCVGMGTGQAVTTAEILPQAMDVVWHAIIVHTVEGHGQAPAVATYLADKLKAGGFAKVDVQTTLVTP